MIAAFNSELTKRVSEKAAGIYFEALLQSQEIARQYLRHPNAQARLGALVMLRNYWHVVPSYGQVYELFQHDQDTNVRCSAVCTLTNYAFGNKHLGRAFAEIVLNDSAPQALRYTCYLALFTVRGWEDRVAALLPIQIPNDIDRAFVNSFFDES